MPSSTEPAKPKLLIYFCDYFAIDPAVLDAYGAFNISLLNDLPLFIDPFLLFNSSKPEYRRLHDEIIGYVRFLRDRSADTANSPGLLKAWFTFAEVKQNWLGFSKVGNAGSGLGPRFASSLSNNLAQVFDNFGRESVTKGSHIEKVCLIDRNVGRDNISDLTTNLVKRYLLDYTQAFARQHLKESQRGTFNIERVTFNYSTRAWAPGQYELPVHDHDYVMLTPRDILTRDESWISRRDLFHDFPGVIRAVPDDQLREQLSEYLERQLLKPRNPGEAPTQAELDAATLATISAHPVIVDHYISQREDKGDEATAVSAEKVRETEQIFIQGARALAELLQHNTAFFDQGRDTLEEARNRVHFLKDVIENKDGYRIFAGIPGKSLRREEVIQLLFRLTWRATTSDVNREVNNSRGPVDFKISRGARDASLVEFKLASNSHLEKNLKHQVEVYKLANSTKKALKVIVAFTESDLARARAIIKRLKLESDLDVIVINADTTRKTSASKVSD